AADFVMGHESPHMSSVYRETISNARLKAITNHVRAWLFAAPAATIEAAGSRGELPGEGPISAADAPSRRDGRAGLPWWSTSHESESTGRRSRTRQDNPAAVAATATNHHGRGADSVLSPGGMGYRGCF